MAIIHINSYWLLVLAAIGIGFPNSNAWLMPTQGALPATATSRYHSPTHLQAVAIPSKDAFTSFPENDSTVTAAKARKTPLSMELEELAQVLGGKGRAQACWDCYRLGVDPLWFFDTESTSAEETEPLDAIFSEDLNIAGGETRQQIQSQILPRRQSQGMGRKALELLKQTMTSSPNFLASSSQDSMSSIAEVVQIHTSRDGTTKLLLQLAQDNLQVECVIIPWSDRESSTLCISNQVGCAQACTFCSTGRMGELRSLTADEILVQVYWASKVCRLLPDLYPVNAIVYMGMGEAARNVNHVVRSAQSLADPQLFQLAPRRVTISTVGPTPEAFEQLGRAPAVLAWSTHASEDTVRKRLVPTTRYSMVELRNSLIQVLKNKPRKHRQIMLELALINDINDRPEDASHLVEFCQAFYQEVPGVRLVVNLIPWNDISATTGPAAQYQKPATGHVLAFQKRLVEENILCYVRTTRGDDESAACGQLATKSSRSSAKK